MSSPSRLQKRKMEARNNMGCEVRIAKQLRRGVAVLALTAASFATAQHSAPGSSTVPNLAGIAHVAIRVANLQASRDFYKKLGYQEAFALDKGGAPTEAFFKVNDRQFIELYPPRKANDPIGFLHVCFESKDLNGLHDAYVDRGLKPTAVRKAGAGNLLFTMRGPENQNIEYTQYMPGSRHTLDIGKHLGADRIADGIVGVGIPMADVSAADAFYKDKMGFVPLHRGFDRGANAYRLAGASNEKIEILPQSSEPKFHLMLGVSNLKKAASELSSRSIEFHRAGGLLTLRDPDGNVIVLVHAPGQSGVH